MRFILLSATKIARLFCFFRGRDIKNSLILLFAEVREILGSPPPPPHTAPLVEGSGRK